MKIKDLPKLLFSIAICEGAGIVGSVFTFPAISTWYQTLNKPSFSPPNFIFGPVWTALYALMGIALYLVISDKGKVKSGQAAKLFLTQLFFNVTWSIMFFGLRNPLLGLINIIILWMLIVIVVYKFLKINLRAGILLLPYLAWVSFAAILNYSIWFLNR